MPWQPTKRALNLGQTESLSWPVGRGRWHRRHYPDGYTMTHFDVFDPDRNWWYAVLHFFVDMIPWFLRGCPR